MTDFGPILPDACTHLPTDPRKADRFVQGAAAGARSCKGGHEVDRWTVDFVHLGLARVA